MADGRDRDRVRHRWGFFHSACVAALKNSGSVDGAEMMTLSTARDSSNSELEESKL